MRIAIDPGLSGAIACDVNGVVELLKMPQEPEKLLALLQYGYKQKITSCIMENVGSSRPGNSSRSSHTFAVHRGHLEMALIAIKVKPILVVPQKWMRELFGDSYPRGMAPEQVKARKQFIHEAVMKLYPSVEVAKYQADALALYHWGATMRPEEFVQ